MPRPTLLTVTLLATMAATLGLTGCQSSEKKKPAYSANPIVDEFSAAKDRTPTKTTLYAMARVLVARGKDDQAAYVLTRVLADHPDYAPAYSELAEIYMRSDATDRAIAVLDDGIQALPDNAILHNNRGLCAMVMEDDATAAAHFSIAADLDPNNARYQSNLAASLALMGEYDMALSVYQQVIPPSDAHYNLAVICESRGDTERAALEYELADATASNP